MRQQFTRTSLTFGHLLQIFHLSVSFPVEEFVIPIDPISLVSGKGPGTISIFLSSFVYEIVLSLVGSGGGFINAASNSVHVHLDISREHRDAHLLRVKHLIHLCHRFVGVSIDDALSISAAARALEL